MKNKILTFIIIVFIIGITGGLGYFFINYLNTNEIVGMVAGENEVSNETIKPIEPQERSSDSSILASQSVESTDKANLVTTTNGKYKYYYDQLDENAKIIYSSVEANKDKLKTGNEKINFGDKFNNLLNSDQGKEKLNNAYQAALDAFCLDYPDVFYIDVTKMVLMIYSKTNILGTKYTVSIEPAEGGNYLISSFSNKDSIENAVNKLESIKKSVAEQVAQDDDYTKIKKIHDFLIDYIEYDSSTERPNTRNIYGALVEKCVVCEGYADAFKYLLDAVGVHCVEVVGTGTNSAGQTEAHAWNYVQLNNLWYAVDVTWDDPAIIGKGVIPKNTKIKYFLKGQKDFSSTHFPSGQVSDGGITFSYPELSKEDYTK